MADKKKPGKEEKEIVVAKNAAELQRIRLEKLMNRVEKPVFIPEKSKDYKPRDPLEFVRNVWGSSAGAGSGDFHVYRGVRRREYARQKFDKEKNEKETAEEAYQRKVVENMKQAEERTAKKRAKRQKKKQKQKNKKQKTEQKDDESESEEEEDNETGADNSTEKEDKLSDNGGNPSSCQADREDAGSEDAENADEIDSQHKDESVTVKTEQCDDTDNDLHEDNSEARGDSVEAQVKSETDSEPSNENT
ncbi:PRKR-interacting protein 1 homolog [Mya arenaria]|uniref:PRKR-interacting protein 1 homolog n=1 Tax=Mya arenaria TaxID=6604 RepID=UPI0022E56C0F|nr:PRKR-interacting protein 1 homolog [Mya arenaria]